MSISLYFAPNSSAFAPLVALEEAGADFQPVLVRLAAGEQHTPAYRAINPRGRVPTLVVDGTPIYEVIAILGWIADRYPDAGLLPTEPTERARAFALMSWIASTVHIALAQVRRPERYTDDPAIRLALEAPGRTAFAAALAEFEARSAATASPFLIGDRFGAVDAYALVVRRWADGLGIDRATFPSFADRTDALFARASVRRALDHETLVPAAAAA
ncbi:glutathione S-transferase family protein [Sphingomonas sp. ZT3P38]|uniref:glutathione S-transferase family protein n=1 Tax=Parasphingomonas zepuensis TaxID=3096161 RepID=UPI002FC759AB